MRSRTFLNVSFGLLAMAAGGCSPVKYFHFISEARTEVLLILPDRAVSIGTKEFVMLEERSLRHGFKTRFGSKECTYPLLPPLPMGAMIDGFFGGMHYFFAIREDASVYALPVDKSNNVERSPTDQPRGFPLAPDGDCIAVAGELD